MAMKVLPGMDDIFIKQQKEFPSNAHRVAWYLGASLLPFTAVVPDGLSQAESQDFIQGEKSLHDFFCTLYTDMYLNPDTYLMTESPDLYFNNGQWFKDRPDMTKAKGKNAHIMKALEVLFEIVHRATLENGELIVSAAEYDNIFSEIRPTSISKPKVKGFLTALRQLGLEITVETQGISIRSKQYPKMFIAMKAICQYDEAEDRQLRFFAFYRCDFEAVKKTYVPDMSQVLSILPQATREQAEWIIAYMRASGYKMELQMGGYPSALWIVNFRGNKKYKASNFFWFGFSIEYLNMFFVELHCMNPQYLIPLVYRKGDEYADWFDKTWYRECDDCGYCQDKFKIPGPYAFEHNGRKRGLCHQCWLGARNLTQGEMESLLRMVALHTEAGMAA